MRQSPVRPSILSFSYAQQTPTTCEEHFCYRTVLYALKSEGHNTEYSAVSDYCLLIMVVLKRSLMFKVPFYKFRGRESCSDARSAAFFQFCKLRLLIVSIHILQYSINAPLEHTCVSTWWNTYTLIVHVYTGPHNLAEGSFMRFMKMNLVKLSYYNQLNAQCQCVIL